MNFYTSDLHFGHSNVIGFDHRPFADRVEMEQTLIYLWNDRVQKDDDIWIIGDFCFRADKDPTYYLRKLKGRKHLIVGNHDGVILKDEKALSYFESVDKMTHIQDHGEQIVMCHFPIADWNQMHHGSWLIYGHIHNRKDDTFEFMRKRERALNAGCMINNYAPASFQELKENNRRYLEAYEKQRKDSKFRMLITLDEERMVRDGLNVSEKWAEIDEMLIDLPKMKQPERGVFVTESSGIRSWFMHLLEDKPWFMKYVASWKIDDGNLKDDVIEGMRAAGIQCSYE